MVIEENTKHKMRVKIRNIKNRISERKDFVFPYPLLPYVAIRVANTHCTHLQITQAAH
jgi:hypothetical protein